jgi:hypothetical protein
MTPDEKSRTSPATVSAAIRKAGLRPLPSGTPVTRQGVRVSRSGLPGVVRVLADYDGEGKARRTASDLAEVLTDAGYDVEKSASGSSLYVTKKN